MRFNTKMITMKVKVANITKMNKIARKNMIKAMMSKG